jgi:DNA repair exonuclease SbcCD ATPase subunit
LSVDILYKGKYSTSYGNMSKGERLRLNFATSRAFRDMLLMFGHSYNLTLIDEYLDNGGDKQFFSDAFQLMKSDSDSVFIISHREDLFTMVDRRIQVNKDSGFTDLELVRT